MSQMDLFAPPVGERVEIPVTWEVVHLGASAPVVPPHTYVPPKRPKPLCDDDEWLLVLRDAEKQIRWRSWTRPHPLPLDTKPDVCGGGGGTWHDGKGVCITEYGEGRRYATWAQLLRGLGQQREAEPEVADARDLAHAYSAVETYHRYYIADDATVDVRDDFVATAKEHYAWLRQTVVDLGGDPDLALKDVTR